MTAALAKAADLAPAAVAAAWPDELAVRLRFAVLMAARADAPDLPAHQRLYEIASRRFAEPAGRRKPSPHARRFAWVATRTIEGWFVTRPLAPAELQARLKAAQDRAAALAKAKREQVRAAEKADALDWRQRHTALPGDKRAFDLAVQGQSVKDEAGKIGNPHRIRSAIGRLLGAGDITAGEAATACEFILQFDRACFDGLRVPPLDRVPTGGGYAERVPTPTQEAARLAVLLALRGLGPGSHMASIAWEVLGLGSTVAAWAGVKGLNPDRATGVLIAAIQTLHRLDAMQPKKHTRNRA